MAQAPDNCSMTWIMSDVSYVVPLLRRDRAFGAIAIVTSTLAIGSSTTVFSVVGK